MSDSAGGEGGGAAGAGQESEADGEPPHPVPLDSGEVGATSEEGVPPCAKRSRTSDEEQEVEPEKAHEETPTEENPTPSAQSTVLLIKI